VWIACPGDHVQQIGGPIENQITPGCAQRPAIMPPTDALHSTHPLISSLKLAGELAALLGRCFRA